MNRFMVATVLLFGTAMALAQPRRKVIIDQDSSGPGGSNMQTLLVLLNSPQVDVVGITVVSGNQWRDEEVAHALRLLEIIDRTEVPVVAGAEFPLVRTHDEAQAWQQRYGKVAFAGAWDDRWWHPPFVIPKLLEGRPTTKAAAEDAAHFLIRMAHKYPHQLTIYEGGPMTNLALAISIDPEFPELARELVFMGGSLSPRTSDPEFANDPRHEFNFWFDPEAARIVLGAPWKKITSTTVDISVKTRFTPEMVKAIRASGTPSGKYVSEFYLADQGGSYMWDELAAAAWIDPSLITRSEIRYMSVDVDHGAEYGDTLTWSEPEKPPIPVHPVEIEMDLDLERFNQMFVELMSARLAAK